MDDTQVLNLAVPWSVFTGMLRRRIWTILTFLSITLLIVMVGTTFQTPVYRSTAMALIDMEAPNVLTVSASRDDSTVGQANYLTYADYYRTQLEVIKSRRVAQRVYINLKFDQDPEYSKENDPVDALLSRVTVEPVKQTRLVKIHAEDSKPQRAAEIANEFAFVFVEENMAKTAMSESMTLMKNEYLKLQLKEAELSKRYKTKFPAMARVRQQMKELAGAVKQELDKQLQERHREVAGGEGSAPRSLLQRLQESSLMGGLRPNNIRVQDLAQVPVKRSKPNALLNLLLGVVVGVLGGIAAAVIEEFPNGTLKVPKDFEQDGRFVLLGHIPEIDGVVKANKDSLEGARERYQEMHLKPQSPCSEAYRMIRTNLIFCTSQTEGRAVVVTSPGSKEGKTTTISNLGIALVQMGSKVLLVDADLRNPHLHHAFGFDATPGLSEHLVGRTPLSDILRTTEIQGLSVVTSGMCPPNPSELLGSGKMQEFLKQVTSKFDWVLIDTPPVISVTDAIVVASLTGLVVGIVQSGRTPREALHRLVTMCRDARAKVLGIILNNVSHIDVPVYGYGRIHEDHYRGNSVHNGRSVPSLFVEWFDGLKKGYRDPNGRSLNTVRLISELWQRIKKDRKNSSNSGHSRGASTGRQKTGLNR